MLGDRLRRLRKEKGWSQEETAKRIGIARGTYAHYEINKREPDNQTMVKLSKLFDVSIDFLITGEDYRQRAKEILKDRDTNLAASDGEITEEEAIRALEFILKRERNRKPGDKQ